MSDPVEEEAEDILIKRLVRRVTILEDRHAGAMEAIRMLDKATSILKRKLDVLDTSVKRLAETADKNNGRGRA